MDTALQAVAFASTLALVVERLVELLLKPATQAWPWLSPYVALIMGLAAAAVFQVDLFSPVALALGLTPLTPWGGILLTGALIGGGSNLIHDLWPGNG